MEEKDVSNTSVQKEATPVDVEKPTNGDNKGLIIMILIAVAIIVIGGGYYWYVNQAKTVSPLPQTVTPTPTPTAVPETFDSLQSQVESATLEDIGSDFAGIDSDLGNL